MRDKVVNTIEKNSMIEQGERITVGFSGGADSVALLYLLYTVKEAFNITLTAVHLNHQLRGEESLRDEDFCKAFCRSFDIDFYLERLDIEGIAQKSGLSIEECAREERYKLFEKIAKGGKIATAHTLTDSLETILINLTRGTGIEGLTGIPYIRGNIIRPIIECTRDNIEQYCLENNLEYMIDSTNLETDYTRNKIRLLVLPVLKEINPSVEQNVKNTVKLLSQDSDYIGAKAREEKRNIYIEGKGYKISDFLMLDTAIRTRILRDVLTEYSLLISYFRIEQMYGTIKERKTGLQLSEDFFLNTSGDFFIIEKGYKEMPFFCVEYKKEDIFSGMIVEPFKNKKIEIFFYECKEFENIENFPSNKLKNLLDYDKIGLAIKFRQRLPGDKIKLAKRNGSKTIKKLFNENKIPLEERGKTVFLESSGKLIWTEGFGVSEEAMIDSSTKRVVWLQVE